ncbi:unnamed protein product, partial [Pylaiella littoralis]
VRNNNSPTFFHAGRRNFVFREPGRGRILDVAGRGVYYFLVKFILRAGIGLKFFCGTVAFFSARRDGNPPRPCKGDFLPASRLCKAVSCRAGFFFHFLIESERAFSGQRLPIRCSYR